MFYACTSYPSMPELYLTDNYMYLICLTLRAHIVGFYLVPKEPNRCRDVEEMQSFCFG